MKILLLFSVFAYAGCCIITSQDCGCRPPDPALNDEVKKWISPFADTDIFVFESETGERDSLQVMRSSYTEYCGGDECGSDCEIEQAVLTFRRDTSIKVSVTGALRDILRVAVEGEHFAAFKIETNSIWETNEVSIGTVYNDYLWDGKPISAIELKCRNGTDCTDFMLKRVVLSKPFGLIEYTTADDKTWKKVN